MRTRPHLPAPTATVPPAARYRLLAVRLDDTPSVKAVEELRRAAAVTRLQDVVALIEGDREITWEPGVLDDTWTAVGRELGYLIEPSPVPVVKIQPDPKYRRAEGPYPTLRLVGAKA